MKSSLRALAILVICLGVSSPMMGQTRTTRSRTNTTRKKSAPKKSVEHSTIEGITEPFRKIELAAAETGLITSIDVEEGQEVTKDQILAKLDDLVLQASLRVAEAQKDARGQLKTSEAEFQLRETRYQKLTGLLNRGHATPEEVAVAKSERDVSEARVQQARESVRVKELEFERTRAQLERRMIRAPIDGVVTNVNREPYEFVSYADPVVLTIVQLDPIVAVFTAYPNQVANLRVGQDVAVNFASTNGAAQGKLAFISPTMDGESGKLIVKVRIPNKHGTYRAGDRCSLGGETKPARIGAEKNSQRR